MLIDLATVASPKLILAIARRKLPVPEAIKVLSERSDLFADERALVDFALA